MPVLFLPVLDPSVTVSGIGEDTVYAGVVLTLTCEIAVTGIPANMLSNIDVSTTWTRAGGNELTSSGRITVTPAELDSGTTYISTVVIDTVRTSNNGMYTCQANIDPSTSLTFIDASVSTDVITLDSQRECNLIIFLIICIVTRAHEGPQHFALPPTISHAKVFWNELQLFP